MIRDFTDSLAFDGISAEAERLFWRLVVKADDYGRFHANARLVKAACFPLAEDLRANTVAAWLTELSDRQLVFCYTSGTGEYLAIRKWRQRLRASVSKFPPPDCQPDNWMPDNCPSSDGQVSGIRPAPAAVSRVGVGDVSRVEDGGGGGTPAHANDLQVELPSGFPRTETEAATACSAVGCPRDFAVDEWHRAAGRGGRDHRDVPIRGWASYLRSCWTAAQSRQSEQTTRRPNGHRQPLPKTPSNAGF